MKTVLKLLLAICLIAVGSSAFAADIVNGGFEDGTFNGWTTSGQTSITSAGTDPRTNNALALVDDGSHSARVGDQNAWGYTGDESSSITQTFIGGSTFTDLYFAWAAVGLVPNNGVPHTTAETPWFQVKVDDVTKGVNLFTQQYYTGNLGSITPGWLAGATNTSALGQDDAGIWYYRPWDTFHLDLSNTGVSGAGNVVGDQLTVTLTTRDCTLNGHASYAYLDGFGSTPPPIATPEPGALLLLVGGLGSLAGLRRKFKK